MASYGLLEGAKYDIGFKDASGNEIGLMLVRDPKTGLPHYKEWTDAAVAYQYSVGQTDYSSLEPMKEIQLGQETFHQGFGAEYFDPSAPRKYYTGTNIDARFKNQVICSPLATAATIPAVLTITDEGLEIWSSGSVLTNWTYSETNSGYSLAAVTGESGYGARIDGQTAAASSAQILQTAVTWSNDFRNKIFTVSVRVYNVDVTAQRGQLIIDDGIGTTTANSVGSGAYETVTCTRKLDAAATKLDIICRLLYVNDKGANKWVDFDTVKFPTVGVKGLVFAEFDDDLFFADGKYLMRMNYSTGAITIQAGFPDTITGLTPFTDDKLYIFQGTSGYYYYMTMAEVVTISNSTKQFATAIGTTLYSVVLPRSVYTATAPTTDAGWSAATTVGSSDFNINELLGVAGIPYVIKEDMTYYIDTTGAVKTSAPQLRSERSTTSGINAIEWQGNIYIPCGAQALYEYDTGVSQLSDISPSKYVTNSTDFDGQIQALDGDSNYLFAIVDNDTKIEVLAGRWETISGSLSWVWHTLSELTLTGCQKCFASSVYKRRLWISSTSASDSLYYYPLTSMYGNITADTDYTYQTGGNLITPFMYCDLRGDSKGFYKISLTMADTTATVYWRAYYQMLGGNWTEINSTAKFKTSPVTTAYLPVETTSSNKPASTMIRFKFEAVTGATSTTPKLLGYDVRALWFPPIKTVITCQVRVADNILLRDGQMDDTQSASSIRTALNAWANPAVAWARAVYPLYWASATDTVYGKLMPTEGMAFCEPTVFEESKGAIEWIYNLTILLVAGLSF